MASERPGRGDVVRFPLDPDPSALWDVLEREGDHVLVRRQNQRSANRRRRLASLALFVSVAAPSFFWLAE